MALPNIIMKKARAYDQAVDICRQTLAHGIEDGTRTGFEGRIRRLTKKREAGGNQISRATMDRPLASRTRPASQETAALLTFMASSSWA